jgi:hypothetical protein
VSRRILPKNAENLTDHRLRCINSPNKRLNQSC